MTPLEAINRIRKLRTLARSDWPLYAALYSLRDLEDLHKVIVDLRSQVILYLDNLPMEARNAGPPEIYQGLKELIYETAPECSKVDV